MSATLSVRSSMISFRQFVCSLVRANVRADGFVVKGIHGCPIVVAALGSNVKSYKSFLARCRVRQ